MTAVQENAALVTGNGTEPPARDVVEALQRVMRDLPAIGRDQTASQAQGGYAYRGIEQITRSLQPLLVKHGVIFVPRVIKTETRDVTVGGKPWTDTILTVGYRICGPGGPDDTLDATVVGIGRDGADKGANKAMTQAFKYVLIQTFCISDAKDDGDVATHEGDAPLPPPPTPDGFADRDQAEAEKAAIVERVERLAGADRETLAAWKDDQGFPYPWPKSACDAINAELDRMLAAIDQAEDPF